MKNVSRKTARLVADVLAVDANNAFWAAEAHFGADSTQCITYWDARDAAHDLQYAALRGTKTQVRKAFKRALCAANAADIAVFA